MSAYLFGVFIFLIVWVILYLLKPKTRRLQLFGSLLLLPFALLDSLIYFRPNYWNPPLLIKAIEPFVIESFLYCFLAGGIAAVFGSFFIKKEFRFSKINILKLVLFFLFSFLFYFLFQIFNVSSAMNNLNFSFLIIWIFLLFTNIKENWKSIIPALMFAIFTIFAINLGLIFYPNFVQEYWNLEKLWPLFFNAPSEEVLFVGIMTALWTLLPKYLLKSKEAKKK